MTEIHGPVEHAIRTTTLGGTRLTTPVRGVPFTVGSIGDQGVVLLLGQKENRTPISWPCLEGVASLLASGAWVLVGGKYETTRDTGTLDGYLKTWVNRATANWVAALLEHAGVVEIDRRPPMRVRAKPSRQ